MTESIHTSRLELRPITLPFVEAIFANDRPRAEALAGASLPPEWPGRDLIEQAFCASLDGIRADPDTRLWGDRLMVTREAPFRVVGSVIFHGKPSEGRCEVAYGVESGSQRRGFALEAVGASVAWALAHAEVQVVQAETFSWHQASMGVLTKLGFVRAGARIHETLGDVFLFERRRG